jgi:hypothetical protein
MRGAVARQLENPGLSATDDKRPEFQQINGVRVDFDPNPRRLAVAL